MSKAVRQTGPKRSEQERERDLVIIAEMYMRSKPYHLIADELNNREGISYSLSLATIGNDVQEIHKRWLKSQVDNMDLLKIEQLKKIDAVEFEAWESFRLSKQMLRKSKTKATKKTKEKDSAPESPDEIQREEIEEQGVGNPAFLNIVLSCVSKRMELFALKTTKIDLTSGGKELKQTAVVVLPSNQSPSEEAIYDDEKIKQYIESVMAGAATDN